MGCTPQCEGIKDFGKYFQIMVNGRRCQCCHCWKVEVDVGLIVSDIRVDTLSLQCSARKNGLAQWLRAGAGLLLR